MIADASVCTLSPTSCSCRAWPGPYLAHEDHACTGAPEGLVCGGGHDVCILKGRLHHACCNQTADVRHVHQQVCANLQQQIDEDTQLVMGFIHMQGRVAD